MVCIYSKKTCDGIVFYAIRRFFVLKNMVGSIQKEVIMSKSYHYDLVNKLLFMSRILFFNIISLIKQAIYKRF